MIDTDRILDVDTDRILDVDTGRILDVDTNRILDVDLVNYWYGDPRSLDTTRCCQLWLKLIPNINSRAYYSTRIRIFIDVIYKIYFLIKCYFEPFYTTIVL